MINCSGSACCLRMLHAYRRIHRSDAAIRAARLPPRLEAAQHLPTRSSLPSSRQLCLPNSGASSLPTVPAGRSPPYLPRTTLLRVNCADAAADAAPPQDCYCCACLLWCPISRPAARLSSGLSPPSLLRRRCCAFGAALLIRFSAAPPGPPTTGSCPVVQPYCAHNRSRPSGLRNLPIQPQFQRTGTSAGPLNRPAAWPYSLHLPAINVPSLSKTLEIVTKINELRSKSSNITLLARSHTTSGALLAGSHLVLMKGLCVDNDGAALGSVGPSKTTFLWSTYCPPHIIPSQNPSALAGYLRHRGYPRWLSPPPRHA